MLLVCLHACHWIYLLGFRLVRRLVINRHLLYRLWLHVLNLFLTWGDWRLTIVEANVVAEAELVGRIAVRCLDDLRGGGSAALPVKFIVTRHCDYNY